MQTYTVFENNQYRQYGGNGREDLFNSGINQTELFHIQNFNDDKDKISLFKKEGKVYHNFRINNNIVQIQKCVGGGGSFIQCDPYFNLLSVEGERKGDVTEGQLNKDLSDNNKAKVFKTRN